MIPGLILAGLWLFTFPLIVDRRLDGIEAMRLSWNTLRGDTAMATVFCFVVGLLAAAGAIVCGVGALFTIPWMIFAVALIYHDFFPDVAAPLAEPPAPPPPPAP